MKQQKNSYHKHSTLKKICLDNVLFAINDDWTWKLQMEYALNVSQGTINYFILMKTKYYLHGKWRTTIIKYTLLSELQHLTLAEKLLIQRVSPLVPVIHIKNGILGTRGHVVSFYQDIAEIWNESPRLPSDITTS